MSQAASQKAVEAAQSFAAAHRDLRADDSIQFDLPPVTPPPGPPAWLKSFSEWLGHVLSPIGRFLAWVGSFLPDAPYARILLWTILAIVAAGFLWAVFERLRYGAWRWPRRRAGAIAADDADDSWQPEESPARAWLDEADALAGEGLYAQAVHHLLIRSIEDITRKRPRLIRPSLTSRDIARNTAIPAGPRMMFADIAGAVERSLFGGRPLGMQDWAKCRAAYADFAQARAWRAQ